MNPVLLWWLVGTPLVLLAAWAYVVGCGDCADARKARAAMPRLALVVSETQKCLIHMTPDVAHCNGCAADRLAGETA